MIFFIVPTPLWYKTSNNSILLKFCYVHFLFRLYYFLFMQFFFHCTEKLPECFHIPGVSIYLAAAAVIVAAVAAESAAVTAAAAEQQDQDDDPPAVITTKATIVTHKEYLRKFRSGFAAHSKIFPG